MKRAYDVKLWTRQYDPGYAVYILDSATAKGKCRKLGLPWKGPGVVEQRITPYLYRVKMMGRSFTVSHDRMKACKDSILPAWIKRFTRQLTETQSQKDPEPDTGTDFYCLCRQPDDGQFMIQCDYCEEWFHGSCVNLSAEEAEGIGEYLCLKCESQPEHTQSSSGASSMCL